MTLQTFPASLPGLKFDIKKTPIWSTRVLTSSSGKTKRGSTWTYPRWKFKVAFEFLRPNVNSELQTLVGFCNAMHGQLNPFYFQDASDYSYTGQSLGIGDGATKAFGLIRTYGGFSEPVFHATVNAVYVNGVAKTLGTDYTLSSSLGYGNDTVNFIAAPAAGAAITADLSIFYVCCFNQDDFEFNNMMQNLWEMQELEFESLK